MTRYIIQGVKSLSTTKKVSGTPVKRRREIFLGMIDDQENVKSILVIRKAGIVLLVLPEGDSRLGQQRITSSARKQWNPRFEICVSALFPSIVWL